jgi:hypothetical protein
MQRDKIEIANSRISVRRKLLKFIFASPFFGVMTGSPFSVFATPDRATIGRPQVYGLGAFGQKGVDQVLRILNTELETIMKFVGATSLSAIKRQSLIRKD